MTALIFVIFKKTVFIFPVGSIRRRNVQKRTAYLSVLFLLPSIAARHGEAIREIKRMEIHYVKAEESRIFAMLEEERDRISGLSGREQDVARLAAQGMRNREIAAQLHVSEETVKAHLKSIFQKLNIDRRSRLVELLK